MLIADAANVAAPAATKQAGPAHRKSSRQVALIDRPRESATTVATSQLLQRKNVAAPPAAGLLMAVKLAVRSNPPRRDATRPAAWTVMINVALLNSVWRTEMPLRRIVIDCVAALAPATSMASCGPSRTRLRKSVK